MKNILTFWVRYQLFWLLFFSLSRAAFLLYHLDRTAPIATQLLGRAFLHGLRLDVSVAAGLTLLPTLLLAGAALVPGRLVRPLLAVYTAGLLLLISLLSVADLELYNAWEFRIDSTFLKYVNTPDLMLASAKSTPLLRLGGLLVAWVLGPLLAYRWLLHPLAARSGAPAPPAAELPRLLLGLALAAGAAAGLAAGLAPLFFSRLFVVVAFLAVLGALVLVAAYWRTRPPLVLRPLGGGLLLAALLLLLMRGSFAQNGALRQSSAYFCNVPFANHLALNVGWNFCDSWSRKSYARQNPYLFFAPDTARRQVRSLYQRAAAAAPPRLLRTSRPNVLFIVWESFTAKCVEPLGGVPGVTPRFAALCREGILFDHLYASSDQSDKGMVALLSGFPAQPTTSIMEIPGKSRQLPVLCQDVERAGYRTKFYLGSNLNFTNMRSYVSSFQEVVDENAFSRHERNAEWGVHDHVVFDYVLRDINRQSRASAQPFFRAMFTISSHPPFDVPMPTVFAGTDDDSRFKNSLYYTDKSLGDFIARAKRQPWWENTLVVILADHGLPLLPYQNQAQNYHIPMLWLGGALARHDTVVHTVCSQVDVAATVLSQLNLPTQAYPWSNDIFRPRAARFAYFATSSDGFGFVAPNRQFVFDNHQRRVIWRQGAVVAADVAQAQAYEQLSVQEYLDK
ncbi:LTA synthase family protein [Hymenobacter rubripertinctus]|uniref:LTA synthase family protein n=1 Tax=Hymenobacter rubripertinctus TaxID=2029981 RepID=A0A418QLB5_9BACT|nr:LTA synthase family protein [Hymenobacter rubripertinctus]RIY06036.1 LTA synthase family protein [Hymenobacter rubripertinctus]